MWKVLPLSLIHIFDEAMHRGGMYREFEAHAREAECNLLKKEVE